MALGYCAVCSKLVSIRPGQHKHAGGRERYWYPVEHDADGKPCRGVKRGI